MTSLYVYLKYFSFVFPLLYAINLSENSCFTISLTPPRTFWKCTRSIQYNMSEALSYAINRAVELQHVFIFMLLALLTSFISYIHSNKNSNKLLPSSESATFFFLFAILTEIFSQQPFISHQEQS